MTRKWKLVEKILVDDVFRLQSWFHLVEVLILRRNPTNRGNETFSCEFWISIEELLEGTRIGSKNCGYGT